MKHTLAQRMMKALMARGYEHRTNVRGGKYVELVPVQPVDKVDYVHGTIEATDNVLHVVHIPKGVLYAGHHRLLVGSSGALRITTGAIADSHPVRDEYKAKLVQEGSAR